MILENRFRARQRHRQATVHALRSEERKDLISSSPEHSLAIEAGHAFHSAIPRDDAAVAVKREQSVDAGIEQAR